jgi:cobalt ECF transporter T component CbiQ
VKLVAALAFILAAMAIRDLPVLFVLLAATLTVAVALALSALPFLARVWLATMLMTCTIALPALVLTPGDVVARLPLDVAITRQGLQTVAFLLCRVLTATTLSLLLVLTTRWADLLRALRLVHTPVVLVAIVGMTYRYIFLLLEIAGQLVDGRRSRRVGVLKPEAERRLAGSTAGALLTRTLRLTEDVYLAMQSRGFRGEVRVLDEPEMKSADWIVLALLTLTAAATVVVGR